MHISYYFLILSVFCTSISAQQHERKLVIAPHFSEKSGNENSLYGYKEIKRPKVALVLSGGGARGMAHLGVLEVLEKNNIPIDLIVGTSIGGVIGGLYASGYSTKQLRRLVDTTDWNFILSLGQETERKHLFLSQKQTADKKQLTIRFDGLTPIIPSAVSTGQRLNNFINQLTLQALYHPVKSFDDLKIPFRCVATDLISGEKIIFSSGNLSEALRASISVPLMYQPLKKDTMELIDGGLVSNIPVEVAKDLGADVIIAVNTISTLRTATQLNNPWEVADQIINIMAQSANEQALDSATIVITPDLGKYSASDFDNIQFAIQQGIYAATSKVNALKDSIRKKEEQILQDGSPLSNFEFAVKSVRYSERLIAPSAKDTSIFSNTATVSVNELRQYATQLYSQGWYSDVTCEIVLHDTTADVVIATKQNPILDTVVIRGNTVFTHEEIAAHFTSLLHKPLNEPLLSKAIDGILTMYREQEYSLARIKDQSFNTQSGMLDLTIDEGIIYKIYLRGKEVSRDWVVWRELGFRDGNVFTVSKGRQALINLYGTDLFEQVLMDVAYEENRPTIIIQMQEKPTDVSRLGFRADNERNLQPTIEFRNENLLGTATEIGASFSGGLRNRKYIVDFQANRIFNTYFTFNLDAYYDLRDIHTYADDGLQTTRERFVRSRVGEYRQLQYGVSMQLGQQVERLGTLNIEYRLESDEIKFISGTGYAPEQFTLQSLRLSSIIDSRDQYPFARTGSVTNFSWETATSTLKGVVGDVGYSKIYFEYGTNISYESFTLHPKTVVGFGDQTLPLSKQFSLGGEDSFFGLREYDSRGRQLFLISVEFRTLFPFTAIWDTYFRVRYDFGSIWPQREDIRIRDFHHGLGFGLSLDSPVGPINFSLGRSFYIRRDLLDQPLTLGPVVAYFSLGYPIL
ncbi:MAG: patatin-like phospholipase family protein [Bacteroidota bacterium]